MKHTTVRHAKYFNQIHNFNSKQSVQRDSKKLPFTFLLIDRGKWQQINHLYSEYYLQRNSSVLVSQIFPLCFPPDVPQFSLCHRYVQWSSFSNQQRSQKRIDCSMNPPYSFHVYRVSWDLTIKFYSDNNTWNTKCKKCTILNR